MKNRLLKCIICALAIGAASFILCGAGVLTKDDVTLNPEKAFKNISIDDVLNDYSEDSEKAKSKYKDQYVVITGIVDYKDTLNYTMNVKGSKKGVIGVLVAGSDSINEFGKLRIGDKVKIYGRMYSHIAGLSIDASHIEKTSDLSIQSGTTEIYGGKNYNTNFTASRSLGKGRMKYYMPAEWAEVESKLDNIEGYQYKLNEISKGYKVEPEQLYVYYFSNEKYLMTLTDKKETEKIEKAIVKNILPKEKIGVLDFPTESKSANGKKFDYYVTSFLDAQGKYHGVEFVFTPDGDEGMCCLLYIFNESNHKDDIIYMMSTLEIEG